MPYVTTLIMAHARSIKLAENLDASNESSSEVYKKLVETISSNPISEVVFMSYFEEDSEIVDFIQVVPYDAESTGYGSFNLSLAEFQMIQREFPRTDFTSKKAFDVRFARKLRSNGLNFLMMSKSPDKADLRIKLGALQATVQTCQRKISEIEEELRGSQSR